MLRRHVLPAAVLLCCWVPGALLQAQAPVDPKVRDAVKAIVEANWTKTADGLAKAEAAHRSAKAAAPSDVRIDYALALMQMRYLRFEEADKTLVGVLTNDADQLDARRLRIRLAAQMKKHTTALEEIDRLSERLAAVSDPQRADERRDGLAYLGKLLAFYQSPVVKGLSPAAVPDAVAKVQGRLTAADQSAFAGEGAAPNTTPGGGNSAAPTGGAATTVPAAVPTGDPAKQAADAETKIRESVARIDALIGPLDQELAGITTNGTAMQAEIARLDGQIRTLLASAEASDDDDAAQLLQNQANAQLGQLRNLQGQLQQLVGASNKLKSKRTTLTTERRVQITRYENDMKRIGQVPATIGEYGGGAAATGLAASSPTGTPVAAPVGNPLPSTPLAAAPGSAVAAPTLGSFIDLSLEPEKARLLKACGL